MVNFYTPVVVLLSGLAIALAPGLALAQPAFEVSLNFPKPSGASGSPRQTTGAGSRGTSCLLRTPGAPPMTVLMPANNIGTTTAADPSLTVYVPRTRAEFAEVTLEEAVLETGETEGEIQESVLQAREFKEPYVKIFPAALKEKPGIVTLTLNGANLQPNKLYRWSFNAVCNPLDRSEDVRLWGYLQRRELDSQVRMQLESATPLERAQLYAQAGIWQETLALAAQIRSSNPQEWMELLRSVQLEAIASAPFVE